jgi:hypothetical protein
VVWNVGYEAGTVGPVAIKGPESSLAVMQMPVPPVNKPHGKLKPSERSSLHSLHATSRADDGLVKVV